jgi:hypothetical protein
MGTLLDTRRHKEYEWAPYLIHADTKNMNGHLLDTRLHKEYEWAPYLIRADTKNMNGHPT